MSRTIINPAEVHAFAAFEPGRGPRSAGAPPDMPTPRGTTPSVKGPAPADTYQDRLLKYIPAEVIALYVTTEGVVRSAHDGLRPSQYAGWLWAIFFICLVATPLYLWRAQHVTKRVQLLISTLSFVVWVVAIGLPFQTVRGYTPLLGALLLPVFTFFVPLIRPENRVTPVPGV